jgi:hypothetical protein
MTAYTFETPRWDKEKSSDPIEVLLGVVADVRILVDDHELVAIEALPIVELAAQLDFWLRRDAGNDFSYDSMEAEEEPLWFRRSNDHWQVGSDWEGAGGPFRASDADVRRAAREFIESVKVEVRKSLRVDVGPALRLRR